MKHAFKTILLSTAVLALAACGSKPAPEENEPAAGEPAVVTEALEQTAEPEPEKKSGSLLYIDTKQSTDLTPAARKALNIPDGRTLESLQAELQAQAQE